MTTVSFDDFADEVFDSHAIEIDDVIELTNVEVDEYNDEDGKEAGTLMIYSENVGAIAISPSAEIKYDSTTKTYHVVVNVGRYDNVEELQIRLLQLK